MLTITTQWSHKPMMRQGRRQDSNQNKAWQELKTKHAMLCSAICAGCHDICWDLQGTLREEFVTWLWRMRHFNLLLCYTHYYLYALGIDNEGQINSPSIEVFRFRLSLYFSRLRHSQWDSILPKTQLFSGSAIMDLLRIVAQGPWAVVQNEFRRWDRLNALWQCCYSQNAQEWRE